jgi:hypothetical protein
LCRLLNSIVGSYIEAFDEEPLPVAVADSAYHRLLDLLASLDLRANAERRLADMNNVAECDRLRLPPASPPRSSKAEKKESAGRRPSQPCPSRHSRTLRSTTAKAMSSLPKMDMQRAAA